MSRPVIRSSRLVGASTVEAVIAAKQKIPPDDVQEICLRVLIAFDAAKRAACPHPLANFLVAHLIMAVAIGSTMKNKTFQNLCMKAYDALYKANLRPTKALDLTTGEYTTIRRALALYLNHLPYVEQGLLNFAAEHAQRTMGGRT